MWGLFRRVLLVGVHAYMLRLVASPHLLTSTADFVAKAENHRDPAALWGRRLIKEPRTHTPKHLYTWRRACTRRSSHLSSCSGVKRPEMLTLGRRASPAQTAGRSRGGRGMVVAARRGCTDSWECAQQAACSFEDQRNQPLPPLYSLSLSNLLFPSFTRSPHGLCNYVAASSSAN